MFSMFRSHVRVGAVLAALSIVSLWSAGCVCCIRCCPHGSDGISQQDEDTVVPSNHDGIPVRVQSVNANSSMIGVGQSTDVYVTLFVDANNSPVGTGGQKVNLTYRDAGDPDYSNASDVLDNEPSSVVVLQGTKVVTFSTRGAQTGSVTIRAQSEGTTVYRYATLIVEP